MGSRRCWSAAASSSSCCRGRTQHPISTSWCHGDGCGRPATSSMRSLVSSASAPNGARHWVRDGWFVEVPDWEITDPTVTVQVGGHQLEMVLPEVVLVGRLVEFDQTGHTGHGAQALLMLDVLGSAIDDVALGRLAASERVNDVLDAFRALLAAPERPTITDERLVRVRDELLARRRDQATRRQEEGGA